jgi:hypothetical protein
MKYEVRETSTRGVKLRAKGTPNIMEINFSVCEL